MVGIIAVIVGIFGKTPLGLVTLIAGAVLISLGYANGHGAKDRKARLRGTPSGEKPPGRLEGRSGNPPPPT